MFRTVIRETTLTQQRRQADAVRCGRKGRRDNVGDTNNIDCRECNMNEDAPVPPRKVVREHGTSTETAALREVIRNGTCTKLGKGHGNMLLTKCGERIFANRRFEGDFLAVGRTAHSKMGRFIDWATTLTLFCKKTVRP